MLLFLACFFVLFLFLLFNSCACAASSARSRSCLRRRTGGRGNPRRRRGTKSLYLTLHWRAGKSQEKEGDKESVLNATLEGGEIPGEGGGQRVCT